MRSQPVEFLEPVEADLRAARDYYDSRQTGGRHIFHEKFLSTIAWIEWNPELFPIRHRHFRCAIIHRSYFGVFFAIDPKSPPFSPSSIFAKTRASFTLCSAPVSPNARYRFFTRG